MKTNLDWLNTYLDAPVTRDEAVALLTQAGFPDDGSEMNPLTAGGEVEAIDFEVTSNRGDCLSHIGLAREVAAVGQRGLKTPGLDEPAETDGQAGDFITIDNQAPDVCPLYTARVIRGVKVGPSPDWLVERLESIGQRSINNVVDITNFVLHEFGQPLHAFDLNKINGRTIVVRRATQDEAFVTLDGNAHKLSPGNLVIADRDVPVALAGVMGGLDSEVTESTTDVLLESAIFEALCVRTTSRKLKIASDSSFRFERGIDPTRVEAGSLRALQLILDLAGGTAAAGVVEAGPSLQAPATLTLRPKRCRALMGVEMADEQIVGYLNALGLNASLNGEAIDCTPPAYRMDLKREIDLIEEVARMHGLANIDVQDKIHIRAKHPQKSVEARDTLRRVLVAHGYHETITPSFLNPDSAKPFVAGSRELMSAFGQRRVDDALRPSVTPSLLECRKLNQDRGVDGVKLFEVASVWGRQDGQPHELEVVSLLSDAADATDALRGMKGAVLELAEALGATVSFKPAEDARYAAAATVMIDGQDHGRLGLLAEALQGQFGLQTPIAAAEIALKPLLAGYPAVPSVGGLARFPGIERDLSIVVDEAVAWASVEQAVRSVEPALLESLAFVGVYRGKPIAKGQKSVSLRMIFRDPERTLTHDEVDPQVAAVVSALTEQLQAELRR